MPFTLDLVGFDTIQERLAKATDTVLKEVDAEMGASAKVMAQAAIRDAPVDQGILRGEISYFKDETQPLVWHVVSRADYSGFVEFGTRDKVSIPAGLEAEAEAVKNSSRSSSLSAREAIFGWLRRKGIDPKFWNLIFLRLMTVGMNPHPFFFKQLEAEKANLLNRLQQIL